jgi:hypothetical protein
MNIPGWALFLFAFFGMGFVLLGPELPLWNLVILCAVVLAICGMVAAFVQVLRFYAVPEPPAPKPAYKNYPPNRKAKRGHFEGKRFVVDEYQEG